ncbi:hypothetical protein D0T49_03445 [Paludibacter sp. 221]|uniref:hypothetical protein n=1 Tax=Paludibacter sp. 221 TaxID=2302939 RepID=UPI0013D57E0B|nr:hypothetical protein [Paludibacter sp. 221]NDV46095.1 hypothetical protein [Paludibacter sp. 221]
MKKVDFINRVMLIMNEADMSTNKGLSLLGADMAQVDRYIEGSYADAWRRCIKVMPRTWFENKSFSNLLPIPDLSYSTGYVVLPDDFYLLTSFKMEGWQKAVFEATIEDEKVSSIQSNEWTRGSAIRPVCTISNKSIGNEVKQVLNYYSLSPSMVEHRIEQAIYVPIAKPLKNYSPNEDIKLNEQLIEPIAYLCASTVYTMFEKYDLSRALEQRAIEMYPGLQVVRGNNVVTKQ